jgi:pilus assembly protein Flp/PilA
MVSSGPTFAQYKETPVFETIAKVRRFLVSEDGPTAVEYAVMLALIVVACVTIIQNLGTSISGTFSSVSSAVSS